jgi:hypothetical protein
MVHGFARIPLHRRGESMAALLTHPMSDAKIIFLYSHHTVVRRANHAIPFVRRGPYDLYGPPLFDRMF